MENNFNGEILTTEAIEKSRDWCRENCKTCIDKAKSGEFKVNNLETYIAWQEENIINNDEGKNDHTFGFRQRAYYFQTGKCIALLP